VLKKTNKTDIFFNVAYIKGKQLPAVYPV